jgi:uncharacterized membrane protein HdeD (DUF308 family)
MTSTPPPTDDTPEANLAHPASDSPDDGPEDRHEQPGVAEPAPEAAEPAPRPEPAPVTGPSGAAPDVAPPPAVERTENAHQPPPEPAVATMGGGRSADLEQVSTLAEDLISRGAPWDSRTSWTIVLVEGIVAAVIGLLFIFKPLGGSSTTLQVVGLILLVGSLITAFQLWRHHLRPEIEQLASFRSGSGVTVGLVVIVATFFVPVTDAVAAALAVVVGIGFVIFGISGIGTSFVRMQLDVPLPLFTLVANAVLALAGLMLVLAGARGADAVDGIFNLLGVLLIAAGLALAGYAYMLRQQDERR